MFLEVTKKDLKLEFKTKSTLCLMLLFGLSCAFLFSYVVGERELFLPLILLISIFTGIIGYSISFLREYDSETIDALKASPLTPQEIVMGKVFFNLFLMITVQFVLFPICFALFDVDGNFILCFLIFLVGNSSISLVITSLAPLSSKSKARELLIPILLFPVIFPSLILTLKVSKAALAGFVDFVGLAIIAVYTALILSISMLVSDHVV